MALIDCNSKRRSACTLCSVLSSVIFGVVAAILRFRGLIAFTPAFFWVLLGASLMILAVLIAVAACGKHCRACKWKGRILNTLLAGILGTVLFSVLLLGIGYIKSTGLSAVLGGVLIAFFSLTVINTACLVKYLSLCKMQVSLSEKTLQNK